MAAQRELWYDGGVDDAANSEQVPETQGSKVYFQPDANSSTKKEPTKIFYQPTLGVSHLVWANSIEITIPHGSYNVDIGAFISANNPDSAVNITLNVLAGTVVGRLNFKNIPSGTDVEFFNYGEVQGTESEPAIVLSQRVKINNYGWIRGGGGRGGRGGNTTYSAPGYINDFRASDNQTGKIQVWFTPKGGNPTPRYHLYEGNTVIKWDVTSGYVWQVASGTRSLHVRAVNTVGTTASNSDNGTAYSVPVHINDFRASDNQTGKIQVWFTPKGGNPTPRYHLYSNSTSAIIKYDVTSGYVWPTNNTGIYLGIKAENAAGITYSNTDHGQAYILPRYISNFNATDTLVNQIKVTFTPQGGNPVPRYHLYEGNTVVKWDVTSGYVWSVGAGTRSLHIKAVNAAGTTTSNVNNGTSIFPSGSKTFTSSTSWVVPAGITSVRLCMIGGGGSGAVNVGGDDSGGGYAGTIKSQNVSVTPGARINIVIGAGGAGQVRREIDYGNISGGSPFQPDGYTDIMDVVYYGQDGNVGASTKFGTVTANGGAGGQARDGWANFGGNGQSTTNCRGTFTSGRRMDGNGGYQWGGQAGFSNGSTGAVNSPNVPANTGTGSPGAKITSGKGGSGVIYISWG